jgi:hypothetical protein
MGEAANGFKKFRGLFANAMAPEKDASPDVTTVNAPDV